MPNCFQLVRKSDPSAGPVRLVEIDEICKHFNEIPDPVKYYWSWYDIIGFNLAMGESFEDQRKRFVTEQHDNEGDKALVYARLIEIVDFLDQNFTPNSWWERK